MTFNEMYILGVSAQVYEVETVIEEIRDRLRQVFPSQIANWDPDIWINNVKAPVDMNAIDAIAAVKLAQLLGEGSVLPTAFYVCCDLDVKHLIKGIYYGKEHIRLSLEDLHLCMSGRRALLVENTKVMEALSEFITQIPSCKSPLPAQRRLRDYT